MDIKHANVERFNTIASEWDSDPNRVFMAQKVARAMRTTLSPTGQEQALELGAGAGLVTLLMAPKLGHVTALDSSAGMLEVLRRKCEMKQLTQVETIEGLVPDQLPDKQYDLIYSSMTLHHIEDVPALIKTLADRIKPGGRIALADLDAEDGNFHSEAKGIAHHGFEREMLASWLRDAGFVDVQFSTAFTVQRRWKYARLPDLSGDCEQARQLTATARDQRWKELTVPQAAGRNQVPLPDGIIASATLCRLIQPQRQGNYRYVLMAGKFRSVYQLKYIRMQRMRYGREYS